MTTTRDLLRTILEGNTPARTPYSLYNWMMDDPSSDRWRRLLDRGLGICQHCSLVEHVEHDVTDETEERVVGPDRFTIYRKITPVGTLQMTRRNGWHHEDWIKTPSLVITHIS